MDDRMAEQRYLEVQTGLSEAFARLDVVESRISRLDESVNTAVNTLMPKVDSLLSARTRGPSPETTSSVSSACGPLPTSVLDLAEQGDHEALLHLAVKQEDVLSNAQTTGNGDSPLHVAASGGHLKAVVVLLGLGAKVNASGQRLRTPLHTAAVLGQLAVAQRLLHAGAEVDAKDADGVTPLDLAAGQGSRDLVNLLLQKGARPNENAISLAAENGHWNLVELFPRDGELLDACNKEGHPLIVLAAKGSRWDFVQLLLEKGASATKCKDYKECALKWASQNGQVDAVRELLKFGTASYTEQVQWSLKKAKNATVVWAFVDVMPETVRGSAGEVGLMQAGFDGRLEALVAFLEAGVNIDAKYTLDEHSTTLVFAARGGNIACVRELLQRGADHNATDKEGNTPLHIASSGGHVECVRALLDAGAATTAKNKEGKTPLEVARSDDVRAVFHGK